MSCISMDVKYERPYYCHEQLSDTISLSNTLLIWMDHVNIVQFDIMILLRLFDN
jgi:hypothetical protein